MVRDGISEEYARLRISAQQPNEYFEERCTYTLRNGEGTQEAFHRQCDALLDTILTEE
jgi:dephospho-CoA kinase